mgnify:CR=1 FL=1
MTGKDDPGQRNVFDLSLSLIIEERLPKSYWDLLNSQMSQFYGRLRKLIVIKITRSKIVKPSSVILHDPRSRFKPHRYTKPSTHIKKGLFS